jgi:quercetin dioxygenase-like cupin family protein
MAIHHAAAGEVIDVRPLGNDLAKAQTKTLLKTKAMEVIRLILPKGKELATHAAPGEITVQCIEGRASFSACGRSFELLSGTMLYLGAGEPHSVQAIEDCSLLVTILLHGRIT